MSDYQDWLEAELIQAARRGPRTPARRCAAAGWLAAVLAICAIVPVALIGGHREQSLSSRVPGSRGVDPALIANFRVLRGPVGPGDHYVRADPSAEGLRSLDPRKVGSLRRLQRLVKLPGNQVAQILPGRHGLCAMFPSGGGGTCAPTRIALKTGMAISARGLVGGILPDRFVRLSTLTPSGRTQPVPLTQGVFATSYPAAGCLRAEEANGHAEIIPFNARLSGRCNPTHIKYPPQPRYGREDAASRRARLTPSAPIAVTITPATGTPHTTFVAAFRQRITNGGYSYRLRGPSGRRCTVHVDGGKDAIFGPGMIRGQIMRYPFPGRWQNGRRGWCPGTYRVDIAFADEHGIHPPFGGGTFVVR